MGLNKPEREWYEIRSEKQEEASSSRKELADWEMRWDLFEQMGSQEKDVN